METENAMTTTIYDLPTEVIVHILACLGTDANSWCQARLASRLFCCQRQRESDAHLYGTRPKGKWWWIVRHSSPRHLEYRINLGDFRGISVKVIYAAIERDDNPNILRLLLSRNAVPGNVPLGQIAMHATRRDNVNALRQIRKLFTFGTFGPLVLDACMRTAIREGSVNVATFLLDSYASLLRGNAEHIYRNDYIESDEIRRLLFRVFGPSPMTPKNLKRRRVI
jgi:hypothetical protein